MKRHMAPPIQSEAQGRNYHSGKHNSFPVPACFQGDVICYCSLPTPWGQKGYVETGIKNLQLSWVSWLGSQALRARAEKLLSRHSAWAGAQGFSPNVDLPSPALPPKSAGQVCGGHMYLTSPYNHSWASRIRPRSGPETLCIWTHMNPQEISLSISWVTWKTGKWLFLYQHVIESNSSG